MRLGKKEIDQLNANFLTQLLTFAKSHDDGGSEGHFLMPFPLGPLGFRNISLQTFNKPSRMTTLQVASSKVFAKFQTCKTLQMASKSFDFGAFPALSVLLPLLVHLGPLGSAESFNRTIVILNSTGGVSSVTNITVGPTQNVTAINLNSTYASGETNKVNPRRSSSVGRQSRPRRCGTPSIPTSMDSVAQFKEWPWHVAIVEAKEDLYICGGSLISETRILTGAHCLMPYATGMPGTTSPKPRLKIRAGEWDVSTNGESLPHVEVLVHKMTLHPQFDNRTLENDIAMIHLARPILPGFRDNIAPVCLPLPNETRSRMSSLKRCVVTGWGRKTETSGYSTVLKEIVVPLWENERCQRQLQKHFGPTFLLPPSALCAGDEVNDACDGDGGGPLVCFQDGKWVQEGIVSYGVGCGRGDSPGIYTRVSSYLGFLEKETR